MGGSRAETIRAAAIGLTVLILVAASERGWHAADLIAGLVSIWMAAFVATRLGAR